MPSSREILCNHCGFPARRGKLPILWPSTNDGTGPAKAYCCVEHFEIVAGGRMPEPRRTMHLEVEASC